MNLITQKESFEQQKLLVVPEDLIWKISLLPLLKLFYITDIGYFPNAEFNNIIRRNGFSSHTIIFCTNGIGTANINGEKVILKMNEFLILPENIPHSYWEVTSSPFTIYWACFRGENSSSFLNRVPKEKYVFHLPMDDCDEIIQVYDRIFYRLEMGLSVENLTYSTLEFMSLMGRIFWDTPELCQVTHYSTRGKINSTIDFMKKNFRGNLSLKELTEIVGFSENYYMRLFRKQTGFSPMDYFIRLKVQNACSELDRTDKLVYEIADDLGFADCYYFSRMFKKIMGVSPRAYRKRKENHYSQEEDS